LGAGLARDSAGRLLAPRQGARAFGGCWQHAAELYGLEQLILATHRGPRWVHHFLTVLLVKKLRFSEDLPPPDAA